MTLSALLGVWQVQACFAAIQQQAVVGCFTEVSTCRQPSDVCIAQTGTTRVV